MPQQLITALVLWTAIGLAGVALWLAAHRIAAGGGALGRAFADLLRNVSPEDRPMIIRAIGVVIALGACAAIAYNLYEYREVRKHRPSIEELKKANQAKMQSAPTRKRGPG